MSACGGASGPQQGSSRGFAMGAGEKPMPCCSADPAYTLVRSNHVLQLPSPEGMSHLTFGFSAGAVLECPDC